MNLDTSTSPLRHSYEHLLVQAERVRQRIPAAAVLATRPGRDRLCGELGDLRAAIDAAPTYGGSAESRRLRREAKELCGRIDVVLERMEGEPNPAKLHRDAAAVLESVRRFALGRIEETRDAA